MSTLKKEDLGKLSVKQLEKFAEGVDGEDLDVVMEVLNEKRANLQAIGSNDKSIDENDKRVSERVKKQAEAEAEKQAKLEEKKKAMEARQVAAEQAAAAKLALKAEAEAEREKKAQEKIQIMEDRKKEREIAMKEKELRVQELMEKKAAAKLERQAKHEEKMRIKAELQKNIPGKGLSEEQVEILREKLATLPMANSKTEIVKNCMLLGFNNKQIAAITNFPTKFICDTTWRIDRSVSFYIEKQNFLKKVQEQQAAESATEQTETQAEG